VIAQGVGISSHWELNPSSSLYDYIYIYIYIDLNLFSISHSISKWQAPPEHVFVYWCRTTPRWKVGRIRQDHPPPVPPASAGLYWTFCVFRLSPCLCQNGTANSTQRLRRVGWATSRELKSRVHRVEKPWEIHAEHEPWRVPGYHV